MIWVKRARKKRVAFGLRASVRKPILNDDQKLRSFFETDASVVVSDTGCARRDL